MSRKYKDMSVKDVERYLAKFDLDINRVMDEKLDETGFDYVQTDYQGRPLLNGNLRLVRERREWPEGFDFGHFHSLLTGEPTVGKGEVQKDGSVIVTVDDEDEPVVETGDADPDPDPEEKDVAPTVKAPRAKKTTNG